jgi:hypothetical protein
MRGKQQQIKNKVEDCIGMHGVLYHRGRRSAFTYPKYILKAIETRKVHFQLCVNYQNDLRHLLCP